MTSRRKRQRLSINGQDAVTAVTDKEANLAEEQVLGANQHTKQPQSRSLFVRSLPANITTEGLTEYFSQSFPLKHAIVVIDPTTKQSRGYGFVTFADVEDAQSAREAFDGSIFEGRMIKVELAEPRHRDTHTDQLTGHKRRLSSNVVTEAKAERGRQRSENYKPPKLIVRNLPWTFKEPEQLASLFRSFGKVKHATLPKKKPGLSAGFGFVVIRGKRNAENALKAVNGKEIQGRTLAVDWAVEKEVWETLNNGDEDIEAPIETNNGIDLEDSRSVKSEDGDIIQIGDVAQSDAEHGLSDDPDSELSFEDRPYEAVTPMSQSNPSTLFIRNLPFTATDGSLKEHFKSFGPVRYARIVLDPTTERSKGTAFVCFFNQEDAETCLRDSPRNIPLPGKADHLNKSKVVSLAKQSLLEDSNTDRSGRFSLDGRVLQVTRAVDRSEAMRLTVAGNSARDVRDKNTRRLYLLSEGTIPSNSPLYDKLAPSEIKLREDSAKQRQTLIKSNPTLHLSLTRLSVRNLPRSVTSKDLKALAREAVVGFASDVKGKIRKQLSKEELARGGDELKESERARKAKGKGIVKQAKIVFEGREGVKVAENSGAGRSRGYGFIEYTSHRWALMGLRWLNGHAVGHTSGGQDGDSTSREAVREKTKRLIVEFAIENAQVVERRREREAKARERSKLVTEKRENGEIPQNTPKELGRNALMAKTRKGSRKGRVSDTKQSNAFKISTLAPTPDNAMDLQKLGKRQQIIEKKRMIRRSRKKAIPR